MAVLWSGSKEFGTVGLVLVVPLYHGPWRTQWYTTSTKALQKAGIQCFPRIGPIKTSLRAMYNARMIDKEWLQGISSRYAVSKGRTVG